MFAALNTVEPPILELVTAKIAEGDKPWDERAFAAQWAINAGQPQARSRIGRSPPAHSGRGDVP
jgi:glutathione S-transferase